MQTLNGVQGLGIGVAVGFLVALIPVILLIITRQQPMAPVRRKFLAPLPPPRPQPEPESGNRGLPYRNYRYSKRELTEILGVRYIIEDFAYNFVAWSFVPVKKVQKSIFNEEELVALAGPAPDRWGGTWSAGLTEPKSRPSTLTRFLGQVMFRLIDLNCSVEESILPPEDLACYQNLATNTLVGFPKLYLTIWRETTYLVLEKTFSLTPRPVRAFAPNDPRQERVNAVVSKMMRALRMKDMFNYSNEDNCEEYLRSVFEEAANIGFTLFGSLDDSWEMEWVSDSPGLVLFPEVRLIIDGAVRVTVPGTVERPESFPTVPFPPVGA